MGDDGPVRKKRKHRRPRDRELNREHAERVYGPVGQRAETETVLYARCIVCNGTGVGTTGNACVCDSGFVATGYTCERIDREVSRGDKYLMLLADVADVLETTDASMNELDEVAGRISTLLHDHRDELEAARTRTKPAV